MLHLAGFKVHHGRRALAEGQGAHYGFADTLEVIHPVRFKAVHNKIYEVGLVSIQLDNILKLNYFPVYKGLGVATAAHLLEELFVMALAATHQRSKQVTFASFVSGNNELYNLLVGIANHL